MSDTVKVTVTSPPRDTFKGYWSAGRFWPVGTTTLEVDRATFEQLVAEVQRGESVLVVEGDGKTHGSLVPPDPEEVGLTPHELSRRRRMIADHIRRAREAEATRAAAKLAAAAEARDRARAIREDNERRRAEAERERREVDALLADAKPTEVAAARARLGLP